MLNNYTPIKYKQRFLDHMNNPERHAFSPGIYFLTKLRLT
jgi:hypothetical protein